MISAKCVKIHGMKDDRWTIKDKMNQYRGIFKLHERDRKVRVAEALKLKGKVCKELKSLIADVKEYRGIVRDVEYGEKRRMHTLLQEHRDFQLAFENLDPNAIEEGIFQDSCLKRRQLDKLYYEKKKKMKQFFHLKLECAILSDKYEREEECLLPNYHQQRLTTEHQRFVAKQNAAKSIRATYEAMLKILEKDAKYFDAVLESLREDRICQCKVLLKATVMGQLAAENLDDTKQRYKLLEKQVWINMKERERTLSLVRSQVQDLWAYAQSLVRVESETNNTADTDVPSSSERSNTEETMINRQIGQLEETFNRVKDSLGVRSYDQLLARLDSQTKHRTRLLAQFKKNLNDRDTFLNMKNHALLSLATLEHGTLTTTGQYKSEKRTMLQEIEIQKRRESDFRTMRKSRGELLVKIRAALQNMLGMLICVKETNKGAKKEKGLENKKDEEELAAAAAAVNDVVKAMLPVEETRIIDFKFEGGALNLLSQVSGKVNTLFAMSNIELDPNDEAKARNLYQRYVADYRSKLRYENEEAEPTGIFVEHETIDSTVLSRAELKLRSRQLVEANTKLE